jgi:hypothetical protein
MVHPSSPLLTGEGRRGRGRRGEAKYRGVEDIP